MTPEVSPITGSEDDQDTEEEMGNDTDEPKRRMTTTMSTRPKRRPAFGVGSESGEAKLGKKDVSYKLRDEVPRSERRD